MTTAIEDDKPESSGLNRRRFLFGSALAGVAVVVAACGGDDEEGASGGSTDESTSTTAGKRTEGPDAITIAKTAAALEILAVNTYKAGLEAATAGKLGAVPPVVAEYAKTAMSHHEEHRDAWNKVLTDAGESEVTAPAAEQEQQVNAAFAQVKDVVGLAQLARNLESTAAATYTKAIPVLENPDHRKLAGSIDVIDRQHIAILNFALGEYPVPETFASIEEAVF